MTLMFYRGLVITLPYTQSSSSLTSRNASIGVIRGDCCSTQRQVIIYLDLRVPVLVAIHVLPVWSGLYIYHPVGTLC